MSSNALIEAFYRLNTITTGNGIRDLSNSDVADIQLILMHYKSLEKMALSYCTLANQNAKDKSYYQALEELITLNEKYFKGKCSETEVTVHLNKIKELKNESY